MMQLLTASGQGKGCLRKPSGNLLPEEGTKVFHNQCGIIREFKIQDCNGINITKVLLQNFWRDFFLGIFYIFIYFFKENIVEH